MARISATDNMKNPRTILITAIAIACHQANKAWCEVNGDDSQKDWNEAEDWQKESALKGVEFRLENPFAGHDAQHNSWMKEKTDDGWVYGEIKDAVAKTHPCIVPFDKLPEFQQKKDALFCAIVDTLSKKTTGLTFEEADELRKIGECIALPEWEGFWFGNIHTGELLVLTKDGTIWNTPEEEYKQRNDWRVVKPTKNQTKILDNYWKKQNSQTEEEGLFTFGSAINALKQGLLVARKGWNGKGMFIVKQIPAEIGLEIIQKMQSLPQSAKDKLIANNQPINYANQMLIVNSEGRADSWVPSSSDVFAEDWIIIN